MTLKEWCLKGKSKGESRDLLINQISVTFIQSLGKQADLNDAPKKYKNSGLKSPMKPKAKVRSQKRDMVRGLNDDDINDECPNFPKSITGKPFIPPQLPTNLKQDGSRNNEVCG